MPHVTPTSITLALVSLAVAAPAVAASAPPAAAPGLGDTPASRAAGVLGVRLAAPQLAANAQAARRPGAAAARRDLAKRRAAAAKRKKAAAKRRARAKRADNPSAADALARIPAYTGPAGAILHVKSTTVTTTFGPAGPSAPTGEVRSEAESWSETGGGRRTRVLSRSFAGPGIEARSFDAWNDARVFAITREGTPTRVSIACEDLPALDPGALLRADRAALASLPAGPELDGVATRVGTHRLGPDGGPQVVTVNYLDAVTGQPIRSTTALPPAAPDPIAVTDYQVWEELPAGGPADVLARNIPDSAVLNRGYDAEQGCMPRD